MFQATYTSLFLAASAAASPPTPNWIRHYNGDANLGDSAWFLAVGPDNTVSVTGVSTPDNRREDVYTIRYDAQGNVLWEHRYNSPLDWFDVPTDIDTDSQGNTYVLAQQYGGRPHEGGSDWDYLTIKYAPDGTVLWTSVYNGAFNSADTPSSMVVDDDGNVYAAGFAMKETDDQGRFATHCHVVKYDTEGNQLWEVLYDLDPHHGAGARDVQIAPDGNIVATGIIAVEDSTGFPQDDTLTLKISPAGQIIWARNWNTDDPIEGMDDSFHVRPDAEGNIYVLGHTFTSNDNNRNFDSLVLKYSPDGEFLWKFVLDLPLPDGIGELAFDTSGNLFITGGWENVRDADGMLFSLTPDGTERWRHIYTDVADFQDALWVTLAPDGKLYVGLDYRYDDADQFDYTIAIHDLDGTQLEQWRFDAGSSSDTFQKLGGWAMDSVGNILIAGYSWFDHADMTVMSVPALELGCSADLDGDSDADADDFFAYLDLFSQGC